MPYQMKNGKWRAEKIINGQRKTASFQTKTEAKKWEASQSAQSWEQESSPTPTICLLDFLTAYLDWCKERYCHKTWNEKRLAARLLLKVAPVDQPAYDITAAQALAAMRLAAHTSGNAANKLRKNLAAAWNWGKTYHGLPAVNPFMETQKFADDKHPRHIPSAMDFWTVYEVADKTDKVFLLLLLHTGARVGEAFRLVWEDIDFENRRIRLGTRKTATGGMEYAWLPMTEKLSEALRVHRIASPLSRFVFTSKTDGRQYTSRQHMMPILCAKAGVTPFGFHGIRHLAATMMAYAGLDLPTIQAMLRHSSPTTTARYIKNLGIAHEKIEAVFKEPQSAKILEFTASKN